MARLNRALRGIGAPADLLAVDREEYEYWRDTPGNTCYAATSEGRVLYEAA